MVGTSSFPLIPSEHTTPFTGVRGETVWKIAEGVSPCLSGGKRRPNWDSFDPSWPLSGPRFGTYPEFPNSFGRRILRSSSPLPSSNAKQQ
jgi:hypothetical protein